MSDHVHPVDCDVDPAQPVQSIAHPHSDHGWTLASTGAEAVSGSRADERLVRSHLLHYVDATWDPFGNPNGSGGAWRHTFALDSLAVLLRYGAVPDWGLGAPGAREETWFVPKNRDVIRESTVRVRAGSNEPAIGVRRGKNLVGFVNGESYVNGLWEQQQYGKDLATALANAPAARPSPSTQDLATLSAELQRRDELAEAHQTAAVSALSIAVALGAPTVVGPVAGLAIYTISELASDEYQHRSVDVPYNEGFEAMLDNAAPVQGHRVYFDVYSPRCTYTDFTVESAFGDEDRSAKWDVELPHPVEEAACDGWGDPANADPSSVGQAKRFAADSSAPSSGNWGNRGERASVSVEVESSADARRTVDASGTLLPNQPRTDFEIAIYESTPEFDPNAASTSGLGSPVHEATVTDAVHCVQFGAPGEYVVEASPTASRGSALETFTVEQDEFGGEHTLTVENPSGSQKRYSLAVESNLQKSTANGASIEEQDSVISNSAAGSVGSGVDSYTFDGGLRFLQGEGLTFTLDGRELDPARHGPMHTLTIESPDGSHQSYSFETTGPVSKSTANGASKNAGDTVSDGTRAEGAVGGGTDSYEFTGELLDFEGDVDAHLNGEQVHSADGPEPTVTVSGPTSGYTGTEYTWGATLQHFTGRPGFNWGEPVAEGDSYFDDGQSQSHTFSEPGTHEITVAVSSDRGETASDTIEVTIEDEPSVDLQVDDPSVRTGDPVQFDVFTSGFDGSPTIRWEGVSASGGSTEASWNDEGTHTVSVTAVAGRQSASDSVDVSVSPEPGVTIDGPSSANPGDDLTFDANVEHFRGNPGFNWAEPLAQGDSYFDDGPTQTYTPSSAGTFEAHVSVSTDEGESAADSLTVDVTEPYEPVSVGLSADDASVQDGDRVSFDASTSGGEGAIDYSWDGASGSGSTATKHWDSAGDYTVAVTASDGQTSDSASVTVSVREPSVSISGPSNVDEGDSVTYEANTTDFLGSPNFNWSEPLAQGDSYFDDGQRQSHHVSSGSDYTVSVAVSSDEGESASAKLNVDVDADTSSGGSYDGGSSSDDDSTSDSTDDSSTSGDDDVADWADDSNDNGVADCADNYRYQECGPDA